MQYEEEYLIHKARKGNESAIRQLYERHASMVLNSSYRIVNQRSDAEDIMQETFIKAYSHLESYNFDFAFGAWLKRIAINKSIDLLRKRKRLSLAHGKEDHNNNIGIFPVDNVEDCGGSVDEIYQAIQMLPDGYRTVFSLFVLEGYDHQEISKILNIGVSTSISQLSRAKKKIKEILNKNNYHERYRNYHSR